MQFSPQSHHLHTSSRLTKPRSTSSKPRSSVYLRKKIPYGRILNGNLPPHREPGQGFERPSVQTESSLLVLSTSSAPLKTVASPKPLLEIRTEASPASVQPSSLPRTQLPDLVSVLTAKRFFEEGAARAQEHYPNSPVYTNRGAAKATASREQPVLTTRSPNKHEVPAHCTKPAEASSHLPSAIEPCLFPKLPPEADA